MSREAPAGAVSRKSRAAISSAKRVTAKPPPPRFPATGYTTARASAEATAASAAFPPDLRTSSPTSVATRSELATAPPVPRAEAGWAAAAGCAKSGRASRAIREMLRPTLPIRRV
jgi:hypothetical protein